LASKFRKKFGGSASGKVATATSPWATGPTTDAANASKVTTNIGAPKPAPAPWDNRYEQTKASLTQNRDVALANVTADRNQTAQNYGFNFDGTENSTDPYSRLATLRADYEKIKRGSSVGYAARGQLYAGSFQNQVNSDQEQHNRSYDSLRKDFQQTSNQIRDREAEINAGYNSGLTEAGNTRIDQAAEGVATGEAPVAAAPTRKDAVLAALSQNLTPKTRKRLQNEARSNGWI
jgi:hypothetical protein